VKQVAFRPGMKKREGVTVEQSGETEEKEVIGEVVC